MCAGRDVHNSVHGVQVGGEGLVVLPREEDELGEPLDGVGWVFGEEGVESAGYGVEQVLDLRREAPRWGVDVRRGRILLVCGLRRGGATLAGSLCHL